MTDRNIETGQQIVNNIVWIWPAVGPVRESIGKIFVWDGPGDRGDRVFDFLPYILLRFQKHYNYSIRQLSMPLKHFFEWVSIDATTWSLQAQNGNYLNFHDLKPHPIGENVRVDENAINDCECPFCRGTSFTQIKNMPFTEKTFFLMCHNWWVIEKAARDLYAHCGSVIELEQLLETRCRKPEDVTNICKTLAQAHALKDIDIYEAEKLMLQNG